MYGDDTLSKCVPGEAKTSDGLCEKCTYGLYSLEEDADTCKTCPDHTECLGGIQL